MYTGVFHIFIVDTMLNTYLVYYRKRNACKCKELTTHPIKMIEEECILLFMHISKADVQRFYGLCIL